MYLMLSQGSNVFLLIVVHIEAQRYRTTMRIQFPTAFSGYKEAL